MKNLVNIFISVSLTLVLATGCNDDDKYVVVDPVANMVKVVSRETTLPAAASQGKVVVEADAPVTVTSTADGWLTTTVEGNTILLNADYNPSLESRSATLTIKSGAKESQIAVIQEGIIVSVDLGGNGKTDITPSCDAQTFEYPLNANCDVEFSTDVDWIKVTATETRAESGKVLVVSLEENSGNPRTGNIIYKAGPREGSIPVVQAMNISGEYDFIYYNSGKTTTYKKTCVISKTATGYNCEYAYSSSEKYNIPMKYDPDKSTMTITNATKIGTYKGYDAFAMILGPKSDGSGTFNTISTTVSLSAEIVYDAKTGTTTLEFVDDGSWSGYIPTALYIRTWTTNTPATSGATTRVQMWYPTLVRAD